MPNYWIANFDLEECLDYGLAQDCWMMQYQYSDDLTGVIYQGDKPAAVTTNWRRTKQIKIGDKLIAYLSKDRHPDRNGFFAIGEVIEQRKKPTKTSAVDAYVRLKRSHDHKKGIIFYEDSPALYENFSDKWRSQSHPEYRYAQRIDVAKWQFINKSGVRWLKGLKVSVSDQTKAFFEVDRTWFDRIQKQLKLVDQNTATKGLGSESDSANDAAERAFSKGQGFQIDSVTRKRIELYAMKKATEYFSALGYDVEDRSSSKPYDLECTKGSQKLFVEVKGTQSKGETIFLTAVEVNHVRTYPNQMALFIQHSVKVSQQRTVSGGESAVKLPWKLKDTDLSPLSFKCSLDIG